MKWCNLCKRNLETVNFWKKSSKKDGLSSNCIDCSKKITRAHYEANKQTILKKQREYDLKNPDIKKQRDRLYYLKNQEKIKKRTNDIYHENKSEIRAKQIQYYRKNQEKISEYWKDFREKNKEKLSKRKSEYFRKRYSDESFRRYWLKKGSESRKKNPEQKRISTINYRARKRRAKGAFTKTQWLLKLEYFNYSCYLCGKSFDNETPTIEHRIPLSKGGTNWIANIAPACSSCNSSKKDKTEKEFRELQAIKITNH